MGGAAGGMAIGFLSVTLIFGLIPVGTFMYLHKLKTKKMDTLVKLVELGGNVDPDMMKMLNEGSGGYKLDYKWGLVWLAIGIPVTLGIWITASASGAVWGLIPVFIGIAFIISGKYRLRESD